MGSGPGRKIFASLLLFLALAASLAGGQSLAAPKAASPGDPLAVWVTSELPIEEGSALLLDQNGKKLSQASPFFLPSAESGYLYGFMLAVPLRARPGKATISARLRLAGEAGTSVEKKLDVQLIVEAKKFLSEDILLDKANSVLRASPDPAQEA